MSDYQATATETCRCGGSITATATAGFSTSARERLDELLAHWREGHDCLPRQRTYDPIPSGALSDVTLAGQWDYDKRPPLGFTGGNAR